MESAKKSLGQHWLNDQASLEAMCAAAEIVVHDEVLEIGPGQGALTEYLLAYGAKVMAVEFDEELLPNLEQKFGADPNFTLKQADIRTYDLSTLPVKYKIVANIPYYLTNYLLRQLADTPNQPRVATLLVQKEVAERVAALPGQLSVIAVVMQLAYEVTLGPIISAKLFTPPPKIDSQILILTRRAEPLFSDIETKRLLYVVKAGFAQRRKTLLNNLSSGLHLSREATEVLLNQAQLQPNLRAQALSLENWHALSLMAQTAGVLN